LKAHRLALYCCLLFSLMGSPFARADNQNLDALFAALKDARAEEEARVIENSIWLEWFKSGSDEVDELMREAMRKRETYDFNGALEVIDRILAIQPDYAEAWNQRATVHFHQQEFERSLEDVARTLELEPRHFGAMAGRAVIRMMQMKPALARQNVLEALKLHPFLKERALFPDLAEP
jgi:Tfp pilus assembly protein PilF